MQKKNIDLSKIPLESSLGLLAVGDIAFTAWRKLKQDQNLNEEKK